MSKLFSYLSGLARCYLLVAVLAATCLAPPALHPQTPSSEPTKTLTPQQQQEAQQIISELRQSLKQREEQLANSDKASLQAKLEAEKWLQNSKDYEMRLDKALQLQAALSTQLDKSVEDWQTSQEALSKTQNDLADLKKSLDQERAAAQKVIDDYEAKIKELKTTITVTVIVGVGLTALSFFIGRASTK